MSIERAVAILTPVFGAVSAWLTGWVAHNFPGVSIPAGDLTAVEIAGFTGAVAAALKWLHGRSEFTHDEQWAKREVVAGELEVRKVAAANPAAGAALTEIEGLLKQHEAALEASIESRLPDVASQVLKNLFASLPQSPAPVVSEAPTAAPAPPQA